MLVGCQDYGHVVGLKIGVTVLSLRASLALQECGVYRFGDPPPTRIGAPNPIALSSLRALHADCEAGPGLLAR